MHQGLRWTWFRRGGDPSQLMVADGVVLCCVWCVVSCRGRGFAKGKKEGFPLYLFGVAAGKCNLAKFGRGRRWKIPKCGEVSLGQFGAGTPFPYSRKLPRSPGFGRLCSRSRKWQWQRQQQQQQRSRLQSAVCTSAGTVRCGTVRYDTVRHSTVRLSTAQYPPSSACPGGGWLWYGKYLAGQPGRLLDQVLIVRAGLVNLKRKKPQDTKAPWAGRVVALGCAPFLASIRLFSSLVELELANLHQGLAANEPGRRQFPFQAQSRTAVSSLLDLLPPIEKSQPISPGPGFPIRCGNTRQGHDIMVPE